MKIGIITSQFNKKIAERLLAGTKHALKENKIATSDCEFFEVPGAFEIPFAAQKLCDSKRFDGIIALGCVTKGDTDHYSAVCNGVTYGIQKISIENRMPIMLGVLMCISSDQAYSRSSIENFKHNKGYECVQALIGLLKQKF